jgi:RNA polymerase sigma-70 factor (ECF subfamily)
LRASSPIAAQELLMIPSDPADFDAILSSTQAHVRAYIAGLGVAAHEVDDLAQDVYIELYRQFDRLPEGIAPERWLKGIARNLCMNHFRVRARRGRLHREAIAEILAQTETSIEHHHEREDMAPALADCVARLPARSRQIVELRYRESRSSLDIARALNSTSEAVRVALHRIRAGLKDCITRRMAGEA